MHHPDRISPPARRTAFTLVELMVAIGAIALIAVGIASIFAAIGSTVAGGRRVGQLNQYAALIERQMRADFEAMTRDGVLVIRHELVGDGAPIELWAEDNSPRPRRSDQILFFVRGDFSSARATLIPGVNPKSTEAMVRYGHGLRLDPIADYNQGAYPAYELPQVDDGLFHPAGGGEPYRPDLALGDSDPAVGNPNRFAADWALLRNLTLLVPPGATDRLSPDSDPVWGQLGITRADALDNDIQIAGQPAAASVFSSLQRTFPTSFPPTIREVYGDDDRHPSLASGLVDVATTDLAEVRRVIIDAARNPWDVSSEDEFYVGTPPLFDDRFSHSSGGGGDLPFMHRWMRDLFPTHAHPGLSAYDSQLGLRPRYEQSMPDFPGAADDNWRLADQRMLGSSVFVPHCTEFIVEYSFGQTYPDDTSPGYGQLIWYGLQRSTDPGSGSQLVVDEYPWAIDPVGRGSETTPYQQRYTRLDGSIRTRNVQRALLYQQPDSGRADSVLTSHFGYVDPLYTPSDPDLDPPTVPWPWPKLIRVTMTLADPNDPSIEQTFQFIFPTPEAGNAG